MRESFVGEKFFWGKNVRHSVKISSFFSDENCYLYFRSLYLEFINLRFKIIVFDLIIINYSQNIILYLQQPIYCLDTDTESRALLSDSLAELLRVIKTIIGNR